MSKTDDQKSVVWPGEPYPLGATWDGEGVNFALFSENAERVDLCLFDASGNETERIWIPEHTDQIWHCYLPEGRPVLLYGYRVYGPYDPANGHRFNPNKLLLDPHAKATVGPLDWDYPHFGYKLGDEGEDSAFDVGRAPPREDAVFARHENERGELDRRQEGRPRVNLKSAQGLDRQKIEQQARLLAGAIMPDGSVYD